MPVSPAPRPQVTWGRGKDAAVGPENLGWNLVSDLLWPGELRQSVSSTVERGPSHAPHSLVVRITYSNLQRPPLPLRADPPPPRSRPLGQCPAQSRCSVTCHGQFFLRTMLRGSLLLRQANRRGESSEPMRLHHFTAREGRWRLGCWEGPLGHWVEAGTRPTSFLTAGPAFPASHDLLHALLGSSFLGPCLAGSLARLPQPCTDRGLLLSAPCARAQVPTADGPCFPSRPWA